MKNTTSRRRYVLVAKSSSGGCRTNGVEFLHPADSLPLLEKPDNDSADAPLSATELPWWSKWLCTAIIVSLGVFLYAHTLSYPFQFDACIYILDSPFIKDTGDFLFRHDFHTVANYSRQLGFGLDPSVNFILRPVAYLTFHLNYLLDGFNPRGYHAVNIGIHCTNAVLLFLLISHFLWKSPRTSGLSSSSSLFIPLAAALLFVAHPLHTESVTYIVQRFTSLVGLFVLLSSYLHFLSLSAQNRVSAVLLRVLSVFAMACGMLTKESMFTAPLMIVMLHVVVMGGTVKRACWQALPHLLCMLIIPSLVLMTSHAQTGSSSIGAALHIASSFKEPGYRYHYLITQLGVVIEYAGLILWPQALNVDRDYPLATSLLEPRVFLSACAIAMIIIGSWWWHRSRRNSIRHALVCGAVFWYFLRLAVSSSFVPLDDIMVDHRTYGASMGMLTALACCMDLVRTHWRRWLIVRSVLPVGLAVWIGALSVSTLNRNEVWKSEMSLWSDTVENSPEKARAWDNLAVAHNHEGRVGETIACLIKAVDVDASYIAAYAKLAIILNSLSRHEEAAEWSRKGVNVCPDAADMHYHLGVALCGLGRVNEAMMEMQQVVKMFPFHYSAHAALGQLYREQHNYGKALQHYKKAVSFGDKNPQTSSIIIHLEMLTEHRQAAN